VWRRLPAQLFGDGEWITTTTWSLIALQANRVVRPLHVDLINTLDPSSLRQSGRVTAVLKVLAQHAALSLTLTADYRTLAAVEQSTSGLGAAWLTAFNKAVASPLHRVIAHRRAILITEGFRATDSPRRWPNRSPSQRNCFET